MALKKGVISTKAEEIELIEKLTNGSGYFAEYFASEAAQMIENIRNDFPIHHHTKMEAKRDIDEYRVNRIKHLEIELDRAEKQRDFRIGTTNAKIEHLERILNAMIVAYEQKESINPIEYFSWEDVTKKRLQKGWGLNTKDAEELISRAGLND